MKSTSCQSFQYLPEDSSCHRLGQDVCEVILAQDLDGMNDTRCCGITYFSLRRLSGTVKFWMTPKLSPHTNDARVTLTPRQRNIYRTDWSSSTDERMAQTVEDLVQHRKSCEGLSVESNHLEKTFFWRRSNTSALCVHFYFYGTLPECVYIFSSTEKAFPYIFRNIYIIY